MRVAIVARRAADDSHVGFGLRGRVESQRQLRAHVHVFSEHLAKRRFGQANRRRMPAFLRRHGDNLSVDELDVILWRKHARIDHPVVLLPGPSP